MIIIATIVVFVIILLAVGFLIINYNSSYRGDGEGYSCEALDLNITYVKDILRKKYRNRIKEEKQRLNIPEDQNLPTYYMDKVKKELKREAKKEARRSAEAKIGMLYDNPKLPKGDRCYESNHGYKSKALCELLCDIEYSKDDITQMVEYYRYIFDSNDLVNPISDKILNKISTRSKKYKKFLNEFIWFKVFVANMFYTGSTHKVIKNMGYNSIVLKIIMNPEPNQYKILKHSFKDNPDYNVIKIPYGDLIMYNKKYLNELLNNKEDLFVIDINMTSISGGHVNSIVVNKAEKYLYYIEPTFEITEDDMEAISQIKNNLGMEEYDIYYITYRSDELEDEWESFQSSGYSDMFCATWSMFIIDIVTTNIKHGKTIDEYQNVILKMASSYDEPRDFLIFLYSYKLYNIMDYKKYINRAYENKDEMLAEINNFITNVEDHIDFGSSLTLELHEVLIKLIKLLNGVVERNNKYEIADIYILPISDYFGNHEVVFNYDYLIDIYEVTKKYINLRRGMEKDQECKIL